MTNFAGRYLRATRDWSWPGRMAARAPGLAALARRIEARVLTRRVWAPLAEGFGVWVNPADAAVAREILTTGGWQPHETRIVRSFLRPGMTAVDIGANVGYFSVVCAAAVGAAGRVISIEPDPENAAMLRETVKSNGFANIAVFECAVGSGAGTMSLTRDAKNFGNHSLAGTNVADTSGGVSVEVRRLDAVLDDAGVRVIDLIKIDVQGWEAEVFRGIERSRLSGATIILEFWPAGLENAGSSADAFGRFLLSLGQVRAVLERGALGPPFAEVAEILDACAARESGQLDVVVQGTAGLDDPR
jgi:FkbM family methyltransferase